MLKATGLQPEDFQGLLRLRASVAPLDSTTLRIQLAPYTHVHWMNDLEKVTPLLLSMSCTNLVCLTVFSTELLCLRALGHWINELGKVTLLLHSMICHGVGLFSSLQHRNVLFESPWALEEWPEECDFTTATVRCIDMVCQTACNTGCTDWRGWLHYCTL